MQITEDRNESTESLLKDITSTFENLKNQNKQARSHLSKKQMVTKPANLGKFIQKSHNFDNKKQNITPNYFIRPGKPGAPRGDQQLLKSPSSPNLNSTIQNNKHKSKVNIDIRLESLPSLADEDDYCADDYQRDPVPSTFYRSRTNSLISACQSDPQFRMKFIRDMPTSKPLKTTRIQRI